MESYGWIDYQSSMRNRCVDLPSNPCWRLRRQSSPRLTCPLPKESAEQMHQRDRESCSGLSPHAKAKSAAVEKQVHRTQRMVKIVAANPERLTQGNPSGLCERRIKKGLARRPRRALGNSPCASPRRIEK